MERRLGPFFAVLVSLFGGALLVVTVVLYALYGYCEDFCDKPPRKNWDAFVSALPWGVAAIGVMTVAAYLFMLGARHAGPSWGRALAVFGGAFIGLVAIAAGVRDGTTAWVVGIPAVIVWEALTALAARRLATRS
jgi:hypothetical protein